MGGADECKIKFLGEGGVVELPRYIMVRQHCNTVYPSTSVLGALPEEQVCVFLRWSEGQKLRKTNKNGNNSVKRHLCLIGFVLQLRFSRDNFNFRLRDVFCDAFSLYPVLNLHSLM